MTIPQSCAWWPSASIKDIAAFLFDPQPVLKSSGFQRTVFDWMTTGLYSKSGDYFRSGMFIVWVEGMFNSVGFLFVETKNSGLTVGWSSRLLGASWLVLSAILLVSLLVREQYAPQSPRPVL